MAFKAAGLMLQGLPRGSAMPGWLHCCTILPLSEAAVWQGAAQSLLQPGVSSATCDICLSYGSLGLSPMCTTCLCAIGDRGSPGTGCDLCSM